MSLLDVVQGSPEWHAARCGSIGGSRVADILRRGKNGEPSASRKNLMADLALERLTGKPREGFVSRAMQDGKDREPEARRQYALLTDNEIVQVGLFTHPTIVGAHASPDGIIRQDGIFEVKCPEPAQHFETLRTHKVSTDYLTQIQWELVCSERAWCDYTSFHPDFPVSMQLCVIRVNRDDNRISEMEDEVRRFLGELEEMVERVQREYRI